MLYFFTNVKLASIRKLQRHCLCHSCAYSLVIALTISRPYRGSSFIPFIWLIYLWIADEILRVFFLFYKLNKTCFSNHLPFGPLKTLWPAHNTLSKWCKVQYMKAPIIHTHMKTRLFNFVIVHISSTETTKCSWHPIRRAKSNVCKCVRNK